MKTCKKCNKIVENEFNFCPDCGSNEFEDEYYHPQNEKDFEDNFETNDYSQKENTLKESSDIINLRKEENNKKKLTKIYIPIILLIALIIIFFLTFQLWLLIFCIPCAIIGLIGWSQSKHTCPNCQTWNSLEEINRTVTGRRNTTVTEKRTAKTYNLKYGSQRTGNAVQETEYEVEVPAQIVDYDVELKCKHCGYTTVREISKTYKQ